MIVTGDIHAAFKLWFFKPDNFVGNKWSAKFTGYNFTDCNISGFILLIPERHNFFRKKNRALYYIIIPCT
ncbi:hypothetical protein HmCmsJML080_02420 [Escherichia coli]|nr:hypothetical protein HmCmsJML080_02420 [Escherichia coli]